MRVLVRIYVHMCYNFFVHEDIIYPRWVMVYIVLHVCVSMNGEVCVCVCVSVSMCTIWMRVRVSAGVCVCACVL